MKVKKKRDGSGDKKQDRLARYREFVRLAAEGHDVDDDELGRVLVLVGKGVVEFDDDVARQGERVAYYQQKQEALALRPKIEKAQRDFDAVCQALQKARDEYEKKTRPLVAKHDQLRESLLEMRETQRSVLVEANRVLLQSASPELKEQLDQLYKRRTSLIDRRPGLADDLRQAGQKAEWLEHQRATFERWKEGKRTKLQFDGEGNCIDTPVWVGGDWIDRLGHRPLPKNTEENIAKFVENLKRVEAATVTPDQVRERMADLERQVTKVETEIEQVQKRMLALEP